MWPGALNLALQRLDEFLGQAERRNYTRGIILNAEQAPKSGTANPGGVLHHRVEDRLKIAGGA